MTHVSSGRSSVCQDIDIDMQKPIAPVAPKSWIRRIVVSSALALKKERPTFAHEDGAEAFTDNPERVVFDTNQDISSEMLHAEELRETFTEQAGVSLDETDASTLPAVHSQGEISATGSGGNIQSNDGIGTRVGQLTVDLLEARRLSAGGKLLNMKSLRPHCVAQLGETAFISEQGERAVAEAEGEKELHRFTWQACTGSFSFEVKDLSEDLRLFVLSKNRPDSVIGQVVVPLSFLFARDPVGIEALWESKPVHFRSGWFEIYPLAKDGHPKFRPAAPTVSKTGMKNAHPLGFIKVACKLEFDSTSPFWTLYFQPGRTNAPAEETAQKPAQTKLINSVFAIMEASRELRRNLLRYRIAKNHIYSVHLLSLYEHIQHVRSWQDPAMSFVHCAIAAGTVKSVHLWQVPFVLFAILALSCILVFRKQKLSMGWESVDKVSVSKPERAPDAPEDAFIIWNNDIQDPRAALNLWQKCALAVSQLNSVQEYIGWASSILEKAINAFNFADHHATTAVLVYAFVCSCLASALLKTFSLVFSVVSAANLILLMGIVYMSPPQARTIQRGDSNKSHVFTTVKLWTLALWNRIPDTNEMGHRFIAHRQFVSTLSLLWDESAEPNVNRLETARPSSKRQQKTLDEILADRLKIIRGESEVPAEILKLQHDSGILWSIIRDHEVENTGNLNHEVVSKDAVKDLEFSQDELEREALALLRKDVITPEEYHHVVIASDEEDIPRVLDGGAPQQSMILLRKEKIVSKGAQITRKAKWFIHSRLKGLQTAQNNRVPSCG